jgi:hypothetical protein
MKTGRWSKEEMDYLTEQVGKTPIRQISQAIDRSVRHCREKARRLGLNAPEPVDADQEAKLREYQECLFAFAGCFTRAEVLLCQTLAAAKGPLERNDLIIEAIKVSPGAQDLAELLQEVLDDLIARRVIVQTPQEAAPELKANAVDPSLLIARVNFLLGKRKPPAPRYQIGDRKRISR